MVDRRHICIIHDVVEPSRRATPSCSSKVDAFYDRRLRAETKQSEVMAEVRRLDSEEHRNEELLGSESEEDEKASQQLQKRYDTHTDSMD